MNASPARAVSETERPRRVLVVDDEEFIRRLLMQILAQAGYEVDLAAEGGEALRKIEARRPDLMVLDLMMPGVDGWTVLERLRGFADPPPVIVLTAHGGYDTFARLAREGVAAYMSKPFSLRELLRVCSKTIADAEAGGAAPTSDRRRIARRPLMVEVKVLAPLAGPSAIGQLVNLSSGGAQVDLAVPLEPGEQVSISFRVPGEGPPLGLEGRVEWRAEAEHGFAHGVLFTDLTPERERLVRDLLGLPS